MGLCHHWRDICRLQYGALEQCRLELALELALAPFFLGSQAQIELAFLRQFALAEDDEVMRPGQLSRHWQDDCVTLLGLEELAHTVQIGG